jgi:RNA methyltransferase, TrmH family
MKIEIISSASNPRLKLIARLQSKAVAYREDGQFLLEGEHLCLEWLAHGRDAYALAALFISDTPRGHAWLAQHQVALADAHVLYVPHALLAQHASGHHDDLHLMALLCAAELAPLRAASHAPLRVLLLDAVQDAGNVGTMLRTAAAFGVSRAVLGQGCAAAFSSKVLRAAMGAHFHLNVIEQADLTGYIAQCGVPVYAADVAGEVDLPSAPLSAACAWLLGSEGQGISPGLLAACSLRVRIPQAGPQSLNVAAAAAVCLYESARRAS